MKAKFRIKTLTPELVPLDDRLVDMDTEMSKGPSETHNGPFMVELTLRDKDDVTNFKFYLEQLLGNLPLAERKSYKKSEEAAPIEPVDELINEIKALTTIDEIIKYLRERHFIFITYQMAKDMELPVELKESHSEYDLLIRRTKMGKNPNSDKYDPTLIMGIKIRDKKIENPTIKIYSFMKYTESLQRPWAEGSKFNYKKIHLTIFPDYMTEDERERWRIEHRKLILDTAKQPSKFYIRWKDVVKLAEPLPERTNIEAS